MCVSQGPPPWVSRSSCCNHFSPLKAHFTRLSCFLPSSFLQSKLPPPLLPSYHVLFCFPTPSFLSEVTAADGFGLFSFNYSRVSGPVHASEAENSAGFVWSRRTETGGICRHLLSTWRIFYLSERAKGLETHIVIQTGFLNFNLINISSQCVLVLCLHKGKEETVWLM